MEKMSRIAKTLSVFAQVFAIMCIVGGCLMVVGALSFIFIGDSSLVGATSSIDLGSVTFELAPEYTPDVTLVRAQLVVGLIAAAALAFFMAYAFGMGRKVLQPMTEQNPFDESVSKNLRKLGIVTLVFGIVMPVVQMIAEAVTLFAYRVDELFLSDRVIGVEYGFEFDFTFIFVACVLFMLSYVFRYGAELQAQSDETL